MSNSFINRLEELVAASVIDNATADRIKNYFDQKPQQKSNRLNLVYAILGAILVGLGFILVIAHNWDDLSKQIKTFLALLPLFVSFSLCAYTIFKKSGQKIWTEACSILYFFSVGAAMSLIGQIYNHEGNYDSFILNWMFFIIPVMWVMPSYIIAILSAILISTYEVNIAYIVPSKNGFPYWYWIIWFIILVFTLYYRRIQGFKNSYVALLWILSLSAMFRLSSFADTNEGWMAVAYTSLFSLMVIIGRTKEFRGKPLLQNPLLVLGTVSTLIMFYLFTYKEAWQFLIFSDKGKNVLSSREFVLSCVLITGTSIQLMRNFSKENFHPAFYSYLLFFLTFLLTGKEESWVGSLVTNAWIIFAGLYFVQRGNKFNSLGWLNFGMLIIGVLILLRFFDDEFSYLLRGLFMLLFGVGFFAANYRLMKQKKNLSA